MQKTLKTLFLVIYYLAWLAFLVFIGYLGLEAMRLGLVKIAFKAPTGLKVAFQGVTALPANKNVRAPANSAGNRQNRRGSL